MKRIRKPPRDEIQFATPSGWAVARVRGHVSQHAYRVLYRGQYVGWLSHAEDGWRWHIVPMMRGRIRVSARPYDTWQVAASYLGRTDIARRIAGVGNAPRVAEWRQHYSVRGEPWVPKPEKRTEAVRS